MITSKLRLASRGLRDAVYGAAVGDALGVPYEFMTRGMFECTGMASGGAHGQPAGTFSDDTSMMLATCDSIRVHRAIDVHDMRK
ncbi:MAG: ADP-ribosylglycohydrolase family protein, partial [Eggerthellaceae bacterium]|nr:ADP-ribosylglycohydrolase family protein [Eggerthellaceae bacterium]